MSEIETAEAFAAKLCCHIVDSLKNRQRPVEAKTEALRLIEARDNAVRVALAAEIQASALALDDTGLTFTWREAVIRAVQVVMSEYTQPKEPPT